MPFHPDLQVKIFLYVFADAFQTHTHTHAAECWQCVPSSSGKSAVDGSSESITLNSANDVHSTWDAAAT